MTKGVYIKAPATPGLLTSKGRVVLTKLISQLISFNKTKVLKALFNRYFSSSSKKDQKHKLAQKDFRK